jgi:hypothetical protein
VPAGIGLVIAVAVVAAIVGVAESRDVTVDVIVATAVDSGT